MTHETNKGPTPEERPDADKSQYRHYPTFERFLTEHPDAVPESGLPPDVLETLAQGEEGDAYDG